ncbi:hypothetical protein CDL15_Pgr003752 [Punica granatum]|uniref:WAT1-related protein n=1 Tax=Punica granatum TaxID=22663 RepID=A0A218XU31_PUNGR|nr:hypothetical protein CDL15_Pgr003752 [Punica granatum]PKI41517.1 hypothetical protein CRG98_038028 [Punica granatum]
MRLQLMRTHKSKGVICSAIAFYVQGVVMNERGPVSVMAFSPLCMTITAALGAIVLAEKLCLGSAMGAVTIVFGLYIAVWGMSRDYKNSSAVSPDDEGVASMHDITDTNIKPIEDCCCKDSETVDKLMVGSDKGVPPQGNLMEDHSTH